MPLYIRDDTTDALFAKPAEDRGITKQDAVRLSVMAELECARDAKPLRERMRAWREARSGISSARMG